MEVRIQRMERKEDAQKVFKLLALYGDNRSSFGLRNAGNILSSSMYYYMAVNTENQEIVGAIAVDLNTGLIEHAVVKPEARRQGIAKKLNDAVLEALPNHSGFFWARPDNTAILSMLGKNYDVKPVDRTWTNPQGQVLKRYLISRPKMHS